MIISMKKYLFVGLLALAFLVVGVPKTFAYSWTSHPGTSGGSSGTGVWNAIASDASGMRLVAGDRSAGTLYLSTDAGATWTLSTIPVTAWTSWQSAASDAIGKNLYAGTTTQVWKSSNYGASWAVLGTAASCSHEGMVTNATGSIVFDTCDDGRIFKSTTGGATWSPLVTTGLVSWDHWTGITLDSTGLILNLSGSHVYRSTDGGAHWLATASQPSSSSSMAIAADSSGSHIFVINGYPGAFYESTDGGLNWNSVPGIPSPTGTYRDIAVDSTGTKLIMDVAGDYVWETTTSSVIIPTVTTDPATVITTTSAFLNGTLNSLGGAANATAAFEYGLTTGYGSNMIAGAPPQPMSTTIGFSSGPGAFTCGTLYHYRAKATNSAGTGFGGDATFTTLACTTVTPLSVTTVSATSVTQTSAVLNANLTGMGTATSILDAFWFGTVPISTSSPTVGAYVPTQPVSSTGAYNTTVSGLTCGMLYHFAGLVTPWTGGSNASGADMTFTTLACTVTHPTVVTLAATVITQTSATINGDLTSMGSGSSYNVGFNWGALPTWVWNSAGTLSSPGTFNVPLTGLTCATTYSFVALADMSGFGGTGAILTFTTLPCPIALPTVITTTASPVGGTTATLNGAITATGGANASEVGFNWNTIATTAGTTDPFVSTTVGGPFGVAPFSLPISGLTCGGTTYHYRAWATNSAGTNYGADMTFTTAACPATPATVATISSSAITTTTATITGKLLTTGGASFVTVGFDYGTSTTYGTSVSSGTATSPGTLFTKNITGLTCATTYHFEATGTNTAGTATGADMTFATDACPITVVAPSVTTDPATAITTTTATLNGTLTNLGGATSAVPDFEYGTSTAYGGGIGTATMTSTGPFNAPITGLTCNTTYHFHARASNSAGLTNGGDLSFTTLACPITVVAPSVTTDPATAVTASAATVNGTVTNMGGATSITVESFSGTIPGSPIAVATTITSAPTPFSYTFTGLPCGSSYNFKASATNSAGTTYGVLRSFTTTACPPGVPSVTTVAASAITPTTATLNGNLTSLGGTPTVTTGFEYGTSVSYGSTASFGSMTGTGSFLKPALGLSCNTLYHFRATATNSAGTAHGADLTFTTGTCPPGVPSVTTDAATGIYATGATVGGTITATGGATVTVEGLTGSIPAWSATGLSVTTVPTSFSHDLTGLSCGTAYTYKASATNSAGTGFGSTLTFNTTPCPPSVTTTSGSLTTPYTPGSAVSPAVPGSANLIGNLVSFGLGNTSATVGFEYGPSATYGFTGSAGLTSTLGSFNADVPINAIISCNTPWHFRATATNAGGAVHGADVTFCN